MVESSKLLFEVVGERVKPCTPLTDGLFAGEGVGSALLAPPDPTRVYHTHKSQRA